MMICAQPPSTQKPPGPRVKACVVNWQAGFLAMLPAIQSHARIAFRKLDPEAREEAVQHVLCNTCLAYRRLVELSKVDLAFPSVLARYGVAQVRSGRSVGGRLRRSDVLSVQGHLVERLDRFDAEKQGWQEVLVEDRHAGPAATAISRLDFRAWLKRLPPGHRRAAALLATGESTQAVARCLHVTAGRVSQLRRKLMEDWHTFQGESLAAAS